jgi:hypothetical protein
MVLLCTADSVTLCTLNQLKFVGFLALCSGESIQPTVDNGRNWISQLQFTTWTLDIIGFDHSTLSMSY